MLDNVSVQTRNRRLQKMKNLIKEGEYFSMVIPTLFVGITILACYYCHLLLQLPFILSNDHDAPLDDWVTSEGMSLVTPC